jgi:hypothetical protein
MVHLQACALRTRNSHLLFSLQSESVIFRLADCSDRTLSEPMHCVSVCQTWRLGQIAMVLDHDGAKNTGDALIAVEAVRYYADKTLTTCGHHED